MEKRKQPRLPIRLRLNVTATAAAGRIRLKGETVNVSEGGLCFTCKQGVNAGTPIKVVLTDFEPDFEITAVVAWKRRVKDHHETGVTFNKSCQEQCEYLVAKAYEIQDHRRALFNSGNRQITDAEAARDYFANAAG